MKIKPNIKFQLLNTIPGFKYQQAVVVQPCRRTNCCCRESKKTHKPHAHHFLFLFDMKTKKIQITEGADKQTSCYIPGGGT